VPAVLLDPEQRFTCQQCGRCCRRGWDIALTPGEVKAYRQAKAERYYREREGSPEGADTDPFDPLPGGYARIRKREDGACGFLSPENRCRIHEELGAERKPLTCRLFPFRFHPAEGAAVLTASFCCPTVVKNVGTPLAAASPEIAALRKAWEHECPERGLAVELVEGRRLAADALATLRQVLREMLDRPGPDGRPDLPSNVLRMARFVEDLSRHRVVRLPPARLAEYVELTGRYAAKSGQPLAARPPSALGRLLARGFLFAVVAAREQLKDPRESGLRLGLRWRLARLLAHAHGLGPGLPALDLAAARRARFDPGDPGVHGLAWNYLRATVQTLGTGRRPVLDELAVAVAFLNAAGVLAAQRAGRAGKATVDADAFAEGLMEAVDLTHADSSGILGRLLSTLSGGVEALYLFAETNPHRRPLSFSGREGS
jgi:Fe-S-cluster containining protein